MPNEPVCGKVRGQAMSQHIRNPMGTDGTDQSPSGVVLAVAVDVERAEEGPAFSLAR